MLKKLLNYAAIVLLAASLVIPATSFASGVSMNASMANISDGGSWGSQVNAKRGDQIVYNVAIENKSASPENNLNFRTELPQNLNYVPGQAKMYYTENGISKSMPLDDSINGNGVILRNIPANSNAFVAYKVQVSNNAYGGQYSACHRLFGNDGVNLVINSGAVNVSNSYSYPIITIPSNSVVQPEISLTSSLYDATQGNTYYTSAINANRGDNVVYRMTIANNSNITVTGLSTNIILPVGINYLTGYTKLYSSANGNQTTILGDSIVGQGAALPDLPAYSYFYITYEAQVADNANIGTSYVSVQSVGNNVINLSDNKSVINVVAAPYYQPIQPIPQPLPQSVLSLTTTGYDTTLAAGAPYSVSVNANRGDTIDFHINFANTGGTLLQNARITSLLPANMSYLANSVRVVINGISVNVPDNNVVSLGDLNVGANGSIEFRATINSGTPANLGQLDYTANGNADNTYQVSNTVNIYLSAIKNNQPSITGSQSNQPQLPVTGDSTGVISLVFLSIFITVASYMYLKETKALNQVAKLIKR